MINAAAVAEADPGRADAWRNRFPFPLRRDYMHGVAILDAKILDFPDVANAPADVAPGAQNFLASGYRAITIMPMMRGDAAIGALSVVRQAPGPLSDEQLALLKTFAAQAVIAIENTRLLSELRARTDSLSESLAQQTAISEILRVIADSPGEVKPVFDAASYVDEFKGRVEAAIQKKVEGKEISLAEKPAASKGGGNVIDLMDMLRASLQARGSSDAVARNGSGRNGSAAELDARKPPKRAAN